MIVLGSTYLPIMHVLADKVRAIAELRAYDVDKPLAAQIGDVDVMIIGHQRITAADMAVAERLKLLQQHGRGLDAVDLPAAAAAGISVANVLGGNSVAVAEHSLALVLALAKQLHLAPGSVASRIVGAPAAIEVAGKTMLIVGLGASGAELAAMANALGMKVLATKGRPDVRPAVEIAALGGPEALGGFLPDADFVVLTATLSAATANMIGAPELSLMKPTAYLVNAARGGLVDYDALYAALESGVIAGAAFDTFWREPADPDDPMLGLETFMLTPHVAGFSDVSIEHVTNAMADNIHRLHDGRELINAV